MGGETQRRTVLPTIPLQNPRMRIVYTDVLARIHRAHARMTPRLPFNISGSDNPRGGSGLHMGGVNLRSKKSGVAKVEQEKKVH
jgi:hypothetical protein